MSAGPYRFEADLWLWEGDAPWHFVTIPADVADDVAERAASRPTAFGSVRVEVVIGSSSWKTSLFPESKGGSYVLPIKKSVRTGEGIEAGDRVTVHMQLVDD